MQHRPDPAPSRRKSTIVQDDLLDHERIEKIFHDHRPDEVYNFAANSVLAASFLQPVLTTMVLAMGVTRILEAIRKNAPGARFFQASSSEIFGIPPEVPQSEATSFIRATRTVFRRCTVT